MMAKINIVRCPQALCASGSLGVRSHRIEKKEVSRVLLVVEDEEERYESSQWRCSTSSGIHLSLRGTPKKRWHSFRPGVTSMC